MYSRMIIAAGLALLLTFVCPVELQTTPQQEVRQPREHNTVRKWVRVVERLDRRLQALSEASADTTAKEARQVYDRIVSLQRDMVDSVVTSSPRVDALIGLTALLRGVAAVYKGDPEEGDWHWWVARQLYGKLDGFPLHVYGEAGEYLDRVPSKLEILSPTPLAPLFRPPLGDVVEVTAIDRGDIASPPALSHKVPWYLPNAKRLSHDRPDVRVLYIIDELGRVRFPTLMSNNHDNAWVLAVMNSLRVWQYEPAVVAGEPVAVTRTMRFTS